MNTTGSVVFTSCSGTVAVGQRGAADAAGGPVEADVAVVAAEQGAEPAGAAGTVGAERAVNSAEAAVATVAAIAAIGTVAAETSGTAGARGATGAGATGVAADAADRAGPSGPPGPADADQPGAAAGSAGLADPAGPAIAAVAIQQATRPAGLPGTRRTIGAVADQGAPEQRLRGRVDHIQRLLQRGGICGLGATICARSRAQGLDKPFMKRGRLRAECLIGLGVPGKQRRHRCRHLVGARGQHSGGRGQRRGIGRAQRRADLRQIVCCRCHHLRRRQYIRHRCPPAGSSLTDRLLLTLARTRVGVSSFYFLTWKNGGPDPASASQPSLAASTGDRDFGSGPSAVGAT